MTTEASVLTLRIGRKAWGLYRELINDFPYLDADKFKETLFEGSRLGSCEDGWEGTTDMVSSACALCHVLDGDCDHCPLGSCFPAQGSLKPKASEQAAYIVAQSTGYTVAERDAACIRIINAHDELIERLIGEGA